METILAIAMGVSLAACAGLRAFLPLLAVGVASRFQWLPIQESFQWIGSNEALVTLGVATVAEVLADKVPVLDHALDVIHSFARPVAGALVATSSFYTLPPTYALALGIILGAPLAGGLHFARAGTRVASTATTGGLGNPVLSTAEDLAAGTGVLLAQVAPLLTLVLIAVALFFAFRWARGRQALRR